MIGEEDSPEVDEELPFEHGRKKEEEMTMTMVVDKPSCLPGEEEEEEEDEEEDEPLIVLPKAEADSNVLLLAAEEGDEFDEPLEQRQVRDILLRESATLPSSSSSSSSTTAAAASTTLALADGQDIGAITASVAAADTSSSSTEFKEALEAIEIDPWDVSSWMIFIEEVTAGRAGGSVVTVAQAYERMLTQFPRSAKTWKAYADYHFSQNEDSAAEEVLRRGSVQCWNVELWLYYLSFLRAKFSQALHDKVSSEAIATLKSHCETSFESAVDQVGWAVDSLSLWRAYLDFLSSWPENDSLETSKKVTALRTLYRRLLCTPVEGSEGVWREYEIYEKTRNEANADNVLADLNKKHQHTRSIFRERKKLTAGLLFDRFATPPSNTVAEMQQLEAWSGWLAYELSVPDYLNAEAWKTVVRMVFQQCLNCFYHHEEVWLAFARFEQSQVSQAPLEGKVQQQQQQVVEEEEEGVGKARALLRQAITAVPQAALLRIALADLEEESNRVEVAKEVLQEMFERLPGGFTFSLYQRLVRRSLGVSAARRLFSETAPLRLSQPKLAVELFISHATLELEVNCEAMVALRALDLLLRLHPSSLTNIRFLRLYTRAVLQTGEIKRLRYVLQCALEAVAGQQQQQQLLQLPQAQQQVEQEQEEQQLLQDEAVETTVLRPSALQSLLVPPQSSTAGGSGRIGKAVAVSEVILRKLVVLYDLFLQAEVTLGCADLRHLNKLRDQRQRIRSLLEDGERNREDAAGGGGGGGRQGSQSGRRGLFEAAAELLERCDGQATLALPESDQELRERCHGRVSAFSLIGVGAGAGAGGGRLAGGGLLGKRDRQAMISSDFHFSMAGLPHPLRELLLKLPHQMGLVQPDIEAFVRHMKTVTLPPRPAADSEMDGVGDEMHTERELADWERTAYTSDEMMDEVALEGGDPLLFDEKEEDVFRHRQRMRLA
eukprot:gene4320-4741_t